MYGIISTEQKWFSGYLMLGLYWIAANLGPIYELKFFLSSWTHGQLLNFIVRSQASVDIDVSERLTYE